MWYLINDKGEKYYLLSKENNVGRMDGDIILKEDPSISRKHAIIKIIQNSPSQIPRVSILDSSKYGTFINEDITNNKCLTKNTYHDLSNGDKIRFGFQWNTFRLCREHIKISYSSVEKSLLTDLKKQVKNFGGVIISKWESDCTHLTMTSITVTAKLIYALACGKPIVNTDYWKEYLNAIINKSSIPDPINYEPPLKEPNLNPRHVSFIPNTNRSKLFYGKTFVIYSQKQYETLEEIIKYAGGRSLCWAEDNVTIQHLKRDNWIMIQYLESCQEYKELARELNINGLRAIPDTELSLAIIYCSLDKYCNPKFNFAKNLRSSNKTSNAGVLLIPETCENIISTQATINTFDKDIIPETQESSKDSEITSIPETQTQDSIFMDPHTSTMKLSESDHDNVFSPSASSIKRKANEDYIETNPKKKPNIEKNENKLKNESIQKIKEIPINKTNYELELSNSPTEIQSPNKSIISFKRKAEEEDINETPAKKPNNELKNSNSSINESPCSSKDKTQELIMDIKSPINKTNDEPEKPKYPKKGPIRYWITDELEEFEIKKKNRYLKQKRIRNRQFSEPIPDSESDSDKETKKPNHHCLSPEEYEREMKKMPDFFAPDSEEEPTEEELKNFYDNLDKEFDKMFKKKEIDSDHENSKDIEEDNLIRKDIYPTIPLLNRSFTNAASKYYIKTQNKTVNIPFNQFLDLSTLNITSIKKEEEEDYNDEEFNQSKVSIQTFKTSLQIPIVNTSRTEGSTNFKLFKKQNLVNVAEKSQFELF